MVDRPRWAPAEVDLRRAGVARVYDFYLGGSHNFASDRAFAEKVLAAYPEMRAISRENRAVLRRMVHQLSGHGADQFLDKPEAITAGERLRIVKTVAHEWSESLSPAALRDRAEGALRDAVRAGLAPSRVRGLSLRGARRLQRRQPDQSPRQARSRRPRT